MYVNSLISCEAFVCRRILNELYSSALTKQSAPLAHKYTDHPYSTVQSYVNHMNHQYTMWKHMLQTGHRWQHTCNAKQSLCI